MKQRLNAKKAKVLRKLAWKLAKERCTDGNLEYSIYEDRPIAGAKPHPEVFKDETDGGKLKVRQVPASMRILSVSCVKGVYRRLKTVAKKRVRVTTPVAIAQDDTKVE